MSREIPEGWELLFTKAEIDTTVERLAHEIRQGIEGRELIIIGLLESARRIVEDLELLLKDLGVTVSIAWLGLKSYGEAGKKSKTHDLWKPFSADELTLITKSPEAVKLVADDMVDSGGTMKHVMMLLKEYGVTEEDLQSLVLIQKIASTFFPDYVGLTGVDQWIAGYGINGNLPDELGPRDGRDLDDIIAKVES